MNSGNNTLWDRFVNWASKPKVYTALWFLVCFAASIAKCAPKLHNNFLIFRASFWHLVQQQNLYVPYPAEYNDLFLYGPPFTLLIAPFAVLPEIVGLFAWNIALGAILYGAILVLEREHTKRAFIFFVSAHELLLALFMQQFNVAICALLILCFVAIRNPKEGWAAFFLVLGTITKVYGIVGLAFFPLITRKKKFIGHSLFWVVLLLLAPALIRSTSYVVEQYHNWISVLPAKNEQNMFSLAQNISLLGIVRKITHSPNYSDLWIITPMVSLLGLALLRRSCYQITQYQMLLLAQVLLYVVILSSGSESSGYITAMVGIAIWFMYSRKVVPNKLLTGLLVAAIILTSFSHSDLMPAYLQNTWIKPYALKALVPSVIALLNGIYLLRYPFLQQESNPKTQEKEADTIANKS